MSRVQLPVPPPAVPPDIDLGPALDVARRLLAGAGPVHLLQQVSVARAAAVLVDLVRDPSDWLRLLVGSLERFRTAGGGRSLPVVLAAAWADPTSGDRALQEFAAATDAGETELARLGFGPKLWFTVNGVPVSWRPLRGRRAGVAPGGLQREVAARDALLSGGLAHSELADLRMADLGRLAPGAVFVTDLAADPLVVRVVPPTERPRLVLLTPERRAAVLDCVARGDDVDAAQHPEAPLLPALASG